jgi:hypothetical protein
MKIPVIAAAIIDRITGMNRKHSVNSHPTPPNTVTNKTNRIGLMGSSKSNPSMPENSNKFPKTRDIIMSPVPAKKHT